MHIRSREIGRMNSKLGLLVLGGALLACMPLLAHHSFAAEYDRDKVIKVSGTVTKFDLSNPHSWIYVDVKDVNGVVVNWAFETGAAGQLYKRGLRKNTLQPGMMITITGYGAKDNSNTADAQQLTLPDGTVITLGTENNPG